MSEIKYTQEQMDLAVLKNTNDTIFRTFEDIKNQFIEIKSNQKWLLGLMGSGFLGLLGLMAHGFKWIF